MKEQKKRKAVVWKILGLLAICAVLFGGGCWLVKPTLPDTAGEIKDEILTSDDYRSAADSALSLLVAVSRDMGLPSLSVSIGIEGAPVWSAVLGMADVSADKDAEIETRYRAGSISKSMTGLVTARLVESGSINLNESIRTYVPSFPEKRWDISLAQLGAHTSGIRHYAKPGASGFWKEQFSKHHYTSVEEALTLFEDDELLFAPGTDFQYSTHGFTLLSAALEKVTGQPYLDLVDELVWKPSGMVDTRADDFTRVDPNRAIPYTKIGGRLFHTEGPDPSYKWAGGGILSTPTDLVRMGCAFLSGSLVDSSLLEELFTPEQLADGSDNPQGYALGWRNGGAVGILGSPDTVAVVHHGGASPGGSSFLLLVPDSNVAAAAMTNLSVGNPSSIRRAVYRAAGFFRITYLEKQERSKEEAISR